MKFRHIAACAALAAAAIGPATASAVPGTGEASRLVAIGPSGQSLTCSTAAHDKRYLGSTYYNISGSTTCGGAIQQSCELTQVGASDFDTVHVSASVFGTTCSLSQGTDGEFKDILQYRTVVTAPGDLVWIGAPNACTGIGTATLDCTFTTGSTPS
jgi:hypothetical protein